jgi:predicted nucleic acid-binding protein
MSHFTAVLDANVLHSYPLTSLLLELADARLFRPAWSADIHAEWMRSVRAAKPGIAPEKLERRRAAMDEALPDACVSGYENLIPVLVLPDADDRHVLAAAIRAKAEVIVTFNERDFPEPLLAGYQISPQHPDTFLRHLIDLAPALVRARVETMLERWANPPTAPEEFIGHLERCGLPETAAALRELFAQG